MHVSTGTDMVTRDAIWKDHLSKVRKSSHHQWPSNWGFLLDEYKKMRDELRGITRTKSLSKTYLEEKKEEAPLNLPPIKGATKFPQSTAQEIGWKAANRENHLEIYGRYCRGKGDAYKVLGWPRGGV